MLEDDILPALEKLRKERAEYMQVRGACVRVSLHRVLKGCESRPAGAREERHSPVRPFEFPSFAQWSSANDNLERLRRFCIAYEFCKAEEARAALLKTSDKSAAIDMEARDKLESAAEKSSVCVTRVFRECWP